MALFGRVLVLLALGCAAFGIIAALNSRRPGRRVWQSSAERAVYVTAGLMSGAILVMVWALVTDDFSFAAVARRIISTTLGIPTSPWHTAAQRPQPTQAIESSRWMK